MTPELSVTESEMGVFSGRLGTQTRLVAPDSWGANATRGVAEISLPGKIET